MEFQCWKKEDESGSEMLLTTPANIEQMRQEKKLDDSYSWQYTIHADSVEEAFALHKLLLNTKV